jgi:hypothetical protein
MISLNPIENPEDGNRMATSVNADLPSELITRIRYYFDRGDGAGASSARMKAS